LAWIEQACEKLVDVDDGLDERFVGAVAVGVDEAVEIAGFVFVVSAMKKIGGDLAAKERGFIGVEDLKFRVDSGEREVLLEKAITEAVHGADVGVLGETELALEMGSGGLVESFSQGLLDARFHFSSGGFGEGDDEQAIDATGRVGADEMGATLRKDGGFSGAGGGADKNAVTNGFDAAALGVGPGLGGGGHDFSPIFSTSC
jgi:hypothetical protein